MLFFFFSCCGANPLSQFQLRKTYCRCTNKCEICSKVPHKDPTLCQHTPTPGSGGSIIRQKGGVHGNQLSGNSLKMRVKEETNVAAPNFMENITQEKTNTFSADKNLIFLFLCVYICLVVITAAAQSRFWRPLARSRRCNALWHRGHESRRASRQTN